jgi:TetR/AcrR family transcriptional repressor of bet genes
VGRQSNTGQRRLEVVLALMRVVARHGYANASILEIAREAGLTPGLIHYHFESKQEILLTLFAHLEALVGARMESRMQAPGRQVAPQEELEAMIDAFLALDSKSDEVAVRCWTMLSAEAVHNEELGQLYREVIRKHQLRIERILLRDRRAVRGRRARIRDASSAILAAIHGSFLLAAAAAEVIPKGSAAGSVKRMARGLLQRL